MSSYAEVYKSKIAYVCRQCSYKQQDFLSF